MSTPAIELAEASQQPAAAVEQTPTTSSNDLRRRENQDLQSLPPVDRGKAAMKYLFGAFLVEALLWGTVSVPPIPYHH